MADAQIQEQQKQQPVRPEQEFAQPVVYQGETEEQAEERARTFADAVRNYDAETAKAFDDNYDGSVSPRDYARGFEAIRSKAANGDAIDESYPSSQGVRYKDGKGFMYGSKLSPAAQWAAHAAGERARAAQATQATETGKVETPEQHIEPQEAAQEQLDCQPLFGQN